MYQTVFASYYRYFLGFFLPIFSVSKYSLFCVFFVLFYIWSCYLFSKLLSFFLQPRDLSSPPPVAPFLPYSSSFLFFNLVFTGNLIYYHQFQAIGVMKISRFMSYAQVCSPLLLKKRPQIITMPLIMSWKLPFVGRECLNNTKYGTK